MNSMNYSQDLAGLKQALADVKEHCAAGGYLYWATNDGRVRRTREGEPDTFHDPADIQDELAEAKYFTSPASIARALGKLDKMEPANG